MKRKIGKRKRQLKRKYLMKKQLLTGGILGAAALTVFGAARLVGKIKESANTVSMVAATSGDSGLNMEQTDSLAEVKAAMAKPASFSPACVESTKPSLYIDSTAIEVNGQTLANLSDYQSADTHSFDAGISYTDVDGIVTFRGNNFRDTASYGNTQIKEGKITDLWTASTGSITVGDATWSGSGWTGQPLMEKWSKEAKQSMNMYDWAKEKDDLVEVIYACMDGYVYFLDLETGEPTREALFLGYTFKGSGALDPRGYPILYVGAGYDSNEGTARVFVVNLLDCSVMYTFGNNDSFSLRGNLSYFDSSALVDAKTDTLIYPGENGILYLIKLNTSYDPAAGTLSIAPDPVVKWHYYGTRTSVASYWLGMEDSAAIYDGYIFMSDNGGNLMCLDLNTLQLVWVQDILDDSNSSPVLSVEDGHLYLYISTSFRLGWRSNSTAEVPVWKIDAETGEIIWQKSYECSSEDGVSGGVQSTIAVGKEELSDYIYVTVARTGGQAEGVLACIDKNTGEAVWEHAAAYAWSSPVCVYNPDGSGKVLYCNSTGHIYLLDGKTGEVLDCHQISEGVNRSISCCLSKLYGRGNPRLQNMGNGTAVMRFLPHFSNRL